MAKVGTRRQVMSGTAQQTAGGLRKADLGKNRRGRIVSAKKKRKPNPSLSLWRQAAKEAGYLKRGTGFKPLPKKGTAAYQKIKRRFEQLKGGKSRPKAAPVRRRRRI